VVGCEVNDAGPSVGDFLAGFGSFLTIPSRLLPASNPPTVSDIPDGHLARGKKTVLS
jgi:hypothetical protein